MKKYLISLSLLFLLLFIVGCTSPNCIQNNSRYMNTHRTALKLCHNGNYHAAANFIEKTPSQDDMLHAIDEGMTRHRAGDYKRSLEIYAQHYPKLKLSAEAEVSNNILRSGLSILGSIVDSVINSNFLGTGTYRYAYGLQFRGEKAKYHLSTPELTRIASFQLMNALKTESNNAQRIAMQHLSDMQQFQSEYLKKYPFIDHCFNELLLLTYFGVINDTAGNTAVAYKRAVDEIKRAKNSYSNDRLINSITSNLYSSVNLFDNCYKQKLKNDIQSYCKKEKVKNYLSPFEVRTTRLVPQKQYTQLKNYIIKHSIYPLIKGLQNYHSNTLKNIENFLIINKNTLLKKAPASSEHGRLDLIIENANAPLLLNTKTYLNFSMPLSYTPPDTSLTVTMLKNGRKIKKSTPITILDPDLLIQLDFQNYLKKLCSRLISKINNEETILCLSIENYYKNVDSLCEQIKNPENNKEMKKYLRQRLKKLIRGERQRRRNDYNRAKQKIENIHYDNRIWFSQPNKIYITTLTEIPTGKATIMIENNTGILKEFPVNIKAGSTTLKIIGNL